MKEQSVKKNPLPTGRRSANPETRTHVGQVIRKYRTKAGMDLAAFGAIMGFTKSAVGNWELGISRPDIDTLPQLCRVLNIPITELLGISQEAALPIPDRNLLDSYHRLNKYNQHTVRQIIGRLEFQQDSQEKERLRDSYFRLPRYEQAAAAGIGTPMLDDAEIETVYVLAEHVPVGTDGIFHVNGRSMEPTYPNGSDVFVNSEVEVLPGQVGIFVVDGESFIKEYRPGRLLSYNKKYPPIIISEDTDIRCYGRVLGVVEPHDSPKGALLEKVEAAFEEECS